MIIERRHDIDWLRVLAIGLLLIYHVAIAFQPWGVFIGFIQSNEPIEAIWIPMSILNIWRIPLLFFVSGMGVWFAIQRRDWIQLLAERSRRILLPYIFGILAIVPLHIFLWQDYYTQEIKYVPNPAHLWFLGNIFVYVILLSPVFFYLKRNRQGPIGHFVKRLLANQWSLLLLMIPFILEGIISAPQEYEMYAMTWHGFALGLVAFCTGFCCVFAGSVFWNNVKKQRWMLFTHAVIFYLIRLLFFELRTPDYLMAVESCLWIFTVFGFGYRHLNQPSKALEYLSQAAYPVYIIHMIFIYIGCYVLFPMNVSSFGTFIIVNIFTFVGSMMMYELLIRRVRFLRPLFGLQIHKKRNDRFGDTKSSSKAYDSPGNRKIDIQTMES
ncbi:acyltransferase [Ekhidna sp.]|uniref:acyltransferase n=1 Tax=Ekhidna sp. TaxID=2608089 RepID=UPI00329A0920